MSRISLTVAALALCLAGCDTATDETAQPQSDAATQGAPAGAPPPLPGQIVRTQAGTELPELTFSDPQGNTLSTTDLKGKPVLINLWATWCPPCVKEMPLLDELATQLGDEVRVLTVSQDSEDDAQKVVRFFAERDFENLEQWLDPKAQLGLQFAQSGLLPTTILFDAEGKELLRVAGDYDWASEDAIAAVREAIAE